MEQQYHAAVFSAGYFGTLHIGDKLDVKRITRNFINMTPIVRLPNGSTALVLSIHRLEADAIRTTQNIRHQFLVMDKFRTTGQLCCTADLFDEVVTVRTSGCQTDISLNNKENMSVHDVKNKEKVAGENAPSNSSSCNIKYQACINLCQTPDVPAKKFKSSSLLITPTVTSTCSSTDPFANYSSENEHSDI